MALLPTLRAFDGQVQQVECPACGKQAGWDWTTGPPEPSMTCRGCGAKQHGPSHDAATNSSSEPSG